MVLVPSFEEDQVPERWEKVVQVEESGGKCKGNFESAGIKGVCQCQKGVDGKEERKTEGFRLQWALPTVPGASTSSCRVSFKTESLTVLLRMGGEKAM